MFFKRSLFLFSASILFGNPEHASTPAGDVSLVQTPQLLEITASDRSIIEWNRFSIGADETVRFIQPSETATVLNRVVGQDVSELFGTLQANGIVYLINPRGIVVGKEGVIDTAAFLASTLDCSNQTFLEGAELSLQGDSEAPLTQLGTIRAKNGDVILVAHQIDQGGVIHAPEGTVSLAASHEILLKPKAFPLLNIRPDRRAFGIGMRGSIEALNASLQSDSLSLHALEYYEGTITLTQEGGKLLLSTEGGPIHIQQAAHAKAPAGEITIKIAPQEEDHKPLYQLGTLDVSGTKGGSIRIAVPKMLHTGKLHANGLQQGGHISVSTIESLIETKMAKTTANGDLHGGTLSLKGGRLFTSGTLEAQGGTGGSIHVLGPDINLFGAELHAVGQKEHGGQIFIGNQAEQVLIGLATKFHTTGYLQHGTVLISAKKQEKLVPRVGAAVEYPQWPLVDPNAGYGSGFGNSVLVLSTGNIVVCKQNDGFAASTAGAAYLYDGSNGNLLSMLTGSSATDQVGQTATALTDNGNYCIKSASWSNGATTDVGACTWGSGTTGVWGTVSASNSLIGSNTSDAVCSSGISALTNGNYVVRSQNWDRVDGGAVANVGAATWGSGTTGITGTVSVVNSLIGSTASDQVSVTGITALTNGNYVVQSKYWDRVIGGAITNVGAATWGSGTTGITGTVSVVNSLIGSTDSDQVGSGTILTLSNGNYVVTSPNWDRVVGGAVAGVGAVTWGSGTTGITGTVSVVNSLIGSTLNDSVGSTTSTLLSNDNYVVTSPTWDRVDGGAVANVGAVTWGDGTTGITGTVSVVNSLIGSTASDGVGTDGITVLSNNNYVVKISNWNRVVGGAAAFAGAATWGSGTTGITGTVSVVNSLIGSTAFDAVSYPGVTALTNGNYVVASFYWNRVDGGALTRSGAATWGDGTTGITGTVSIINSLIGSTSEDHVSMGDSSSVTTVLALTNGNYVVPSATWHRVVGGALGVGAATWGNGTTGTTGTVSVINSLIGSSGTDLVGWHLYALTNGNYVVSSEYWDRVDGGAVINVGAATWGAGTTGTTGTVSVVNSLIGSTAGDFVSETGVTALPNGNYVVRSEHWSWAGGSPLYAGAATWGDGTTGVTGTVSVVTSLVGFSSGDRIGSGTGIALSSGNYVVNSPSFTAEGYIGDQGAATWGNATTGITGTVSKINSVVGTAPSGLLQTPIDHPTVWNSFVCQFTGTGSVIIGGLPPVTLATPDPSESNKISE